MSEIVKKVESIETEKEILGTLPKNNNKNLKLYLNKVKELEEEYLKIEKELLKEMEERYRSAINLEKDVEEENLSETLANSTSILYLLNDIDTPYEKMDLDKAIHNLSFFYKKDLDTVNENIIYCLKKFQEVGIDIRKEDIPYSKYVKEYISLFINNMEEGELDKERAKNKFEEIYWKCPNIITYLQLNLRCIYLKNEKKIIKYYETKKSNLLKKFTKEDLISRAKELQIQIDEVKQNNKNDIILKFINGELSVKDYNKSSINAKYAKFINGFNLENAEEETLNEIDVNLDKLLKSLYEYKNYLKYKFIIDDVKKIYAEKDKYKNSYNQAKKEIEKIEKKVINLDKAINSKKAFKKANNKETEQDELILQLKKLYKEEDKNKVYNKIAVELNDSSSLEDALYLAGSFYSYLFEIIRNHNKEMPEEEINKFIDELNEFIKWPYSTMINNIKLQENKDMMVIVKDRYQLLNINVTKDDLAEENLDILISLINATRIYHNIRINKINIEELACINEFKKILDKQ